MNKIDVKQNVIELIDSNEKLLKLYGLNEVDKILYVKGFIEALKHVKMVITHNEIINDKAV